MITRRTLWLSIIVSMVIGGFAGFGIDRYKMQSNDSHFGKTRFINYMTKELNLTESQKGELDSIISFAHPKFQAIRKKFNADLQDQMDSTRQMISNILNGEQQKKFQIVLSQMKRDSDNH